MQDAFNFASLLASNTIWAHMFHRYGMPGAACALLSRDVDERRGTAWFLEQIVTSVLDLHSLFQRSGPESAAGKKRASILGDLLEDLAWQKETLPLELMSMLVQSNYDHDNREIKKLLLRLKTGTSTTKELLESTFAHLTSVSHRHNKNRKMNLASKWIYAAACKHHKRSAPQIFPALGDWFTYSLADRKLANEFANLGNVSGEALPDIPVGDDARFPATVHDIAKKGWRHAGPLSHQISAAALAYILTDCKNNFENVQHAQLGPAKT